MDILVTGANGFVGEAISRVLSKRNHRVTRLVRRPDPAILRDSALFRIEADILNHEDLAKSLRGKHFDAVIDTAAAIPRPDVMHEDYFDNISMTRNLLAALKETPPDHFIKLSTVDVYKINHPLTEHSEIAPDNYYAFSKRVSEETTDLWSKTLGVTSCIMRLTQVFGPGDRSGKFIPSILGRVKEGLPVVLFGDGSDLRDYLYVEDAAAIIAILCEKRSTGILNLATGTSRPLSDVIDTLQRIAGKDIIVERRERRKPRLDYIFDTAKLSGILKDYTFTDFDDALRATYKKVAEQPREEETKYVQSFSLDNIASVHSEEKGFEFTLMKYKIMAITPLCKGGKMLDIGCGVGLLTRSLAPRFRKVVGIDGSALKIQKAVNYNSAPNIAYLRTLFEDFTPDEPFDFIVSTNVLEHVENSVLFLKKIKSWLGPNGRVVMTVPNAKGLHKRIGKIMGLIDDMFSLTAADRQKGHRRVYDSASLVTDFEKAGFRVERVEGILLKPLSHSQMEGWEVPIVDALYEIGKELPDYCSSLLIAATHQAGK